MNTEKQLTWKSGTFSNKIKVYEDNNIIGSLDMSMMSKNSKVTLYNNEFCVENKSIWNSDSLIIDLNTNEVIGELTYTKLLGKAKITLDGKSYKWKTRNIFTSKWDLVDDEDRVYASYHSSLSSGKITISTPHPTLILIGLYSYVYMNQVSMLSSAGIA
ncbi:hypothetical protein [Flammeovirga sp. SJP92]|uniref:hypothetical protein n=1 Tax=Flammeovirga sp. SJP92 TaxID=1775430 RepID=UPI000789A1DC|nr:hypothetical protein [Flammeovirga sp. SJP92]KXX71483.1 hypothetical protein AVL50_06155 [Flammeovirga sp. SJP92]